MKNVYIIGAGVGNRDFIHKRALDLLKQSDCLIGAKRMLEIFSYMNKEMFESSQTERIYEYITEQGKYENFAVLVSGDTGFYSLSKKLTEMLVKNRDIFAVNIPSVSSLQYFCSKINISWDNLKFVSAHGRSLNIISNIMFNKKIFMLTGGELKPETICNILKEKGLGHLRVSVGENLSYDNERILEDSASNVADMNFKSLAVMVVHNDDALEMDRGLRSIKDEEFITGKAPMTKSEVRTISISKLNLKSDYVVYDIGAGTGSVSIEIALKLFNGSLYAIEKNEEAVESIQKNIKKFKAYNISVIKDTAPKGLEDLPSPDSVFIGGSSGNMDEIINLILKKNPCVNVVINAITLQSLNEAMRCMEKYKFKNIEIVNVSVSKSKKIGQYDMMMGQNPIYVISGKGSGLY